MSRPPWLQAQLTRLLAQKGHAWLLQGPSGLGQYPLALDMARAWLCENPTPQGACDACPSCHAIAVRTHADLCVLMPEVDMAALSWPLSEKAQADIDDKKRKASREIRIDAMRDAVGFSQRTGARGRGKVVLIYPAEQMNHITANALLKTLEEPPGDVRFVLASEAAHQLLPTIRSRCMTHTMAWPESAEALAWMQAEGAGESAPALLRAAGGRPADAMAYAASGRVPAAWAQLPRALAKGDGSPFADWAPAAAIDALQKLCHDLQLRQVGAAPRFFEVKDLPAAPPSIGVLAQWARDLMAAARTADHPFNAGLMLEALVGQAQIALNSKA